MSYRNTCESFGELKKTVETFAQGSCSHSISHSPKLPLTAFLFIIWLAPRAGKMNQILRCDWLPERARWSHLARSGLPALSRKKNFPKSHIINPLLTKLVRSRWLDIGLVFFCVFIDLNSVSVHKHAKKKNSANIQPS